MQNFPRNLLVLFFLLTVSVASGQFNYKPGQVITNNNDTLRGLIRDAGDIRNSRVCIYKPGKQGEKVMFYPGDIKSYLFFGEKYYRALDLTFSEDSGRVFSDVLLDGKVSLYYYRKYPQMAYYIEKDGNTIGLLNQKVSIPLSSSGLYSIMQNKSYTPVYSDKFFNQTNSNIFIDLYKDTLAYVFSESEKILNLLENVEYRKKSLVNITRAYLDETCGGPGCIRYERDLELSKPSFGVFAGVQFSKISFLDYTVQSGTKTDSYPLDLKSDILVTAPVGIFYNIPVNSVTERLSFQAEMILNVLNYKQGFIISPDSFFNVGVSSKSISVPLKLKYRFPQKTFSPSLAIGKEQGFVVSSSVYYGLEENLLLHIYPKGGWFGELGVDYKLNPRTLLFANLRFQSNYNLVINEKSNYHMPYSRVYEFRNYVSRYFTNFATLYFGVEF